MINYVIAAIAAGLYLVFAGTLSVSEIGVALAVGALSVMWSSLVRRQTQRRFQFTRAVYELVGRAPGLLLGGAYRTGAVLLKVSVRGGLSPGKALRVLFEPGPRDSGRDRTRRALAVLFASLAPDSFVVRLDRGRAALFHTIVGTQEGDRDPRLLI